jgi:hypothetical protein
MTKTAEQKWFKRLERCLKDMPNTVEVSVSAYGIVNLHKRGTTLEYFKEYGDGDNVPVIEYFKVKNIRGEESSV